MKKEKQVQSNGIDLGDSLVINETDKEGCKYLGIIDRDNVCQETMKKIYKKNIINKLG